MKRLLSAAAAVVLTVGLVWLAGSTSGDVPPPGTTAVAAAGDPDEGDDERDRGSERGRAASAGHGPPPWAKGPEGAGASEDERGWHAAWQQLTPEQREQTMTRLADEHASGMRVWARCTSEGRDDCEKPLPPGLAKKQLRP